jgi:amidase
MADLLSSTARELLGALEARTVSARELLDASVARESATHAAVNAVVATDVEAARKAAGEIDDARVRGDRLGRLAGLPMTVKDCYDVRGMPAVVGSPELVGRDPDVEDADLVAAVKTAGAVVWGKTNTPLMLADVQSYNEVYGTTNNPYDTTRTCGGSSGGSAAALATDVTSLEIGSDIAGSLRTPSGFCGVLALKPTWGRLSKRGSIPPLPGTTGGGETLSVAGPMARTAGDLRLLWEVLAATPTQPRPTDGMRVALWLDEPGFAVSSDVRATVEAVAQELREQGVVVEVATPPVGGDELLDTYFSLLFAVFGARLPDEARAQMLAARPQALAAVAAGASRYGAEAVMLKLTADQAELDAAQATREAMQARVAEWFGQWDALITPVTAVPAFPHTQDGGVPDRRLDIDGSAEPYGHIFDWIAFATGLQLPAVSVPGGRTPAGLPVGVQLIGPAAGEARLLDLADTVESAVGPLPRPPI